MKYPKINTLFKRDKDNKFVIMPGMYSEPIFEYIDRWTVSEKIHGQNLRIMYEYSVGNINSTGVENIVENETLKFGGRTDNAQLPVFLYEKLMQLFDKEKMREVFVKKNKEGQPLPIKVILFGEGYGNRIQKGGGNYILGGVDFALFDIYVFESNLDRSVRGWWMKREVVAKISDQLGIDTAPEYHDRTYTKSEIIEMVKNKVTSNIAENEDHIAEGIVARADPPILFRNGHPVMFKLKVEDYEKVG